MSVIVITRRASILPRSKGGALASAEPPGSAADLYTHLRWGSKYASLAGFLVYRQKIEVRRWMSLTIEDLRWEFGASRAWMYKYLAPHIKSITVKCSTDDGERLCKRYSLDDARRVVAERLEPRSIPCPLKRTPGKAAMLHTAARGAYESRRARTSPNISSASVISGSIMIVDRYAAVSAQERRHINYLP